MSRNPCYLAIDLGAESGRAILGRLENDRLAMEEVHRFENVPVRLRSTLVWDLPRILHEVETGIRAAAERAEGELSGIAVDSWGVDYGLLDESGALLALPVHYRDDRTRGLLEEIFRRTPREEIFDVTGNQFLEINTLVQLVAQKKRFPESLFVADRLLFMADLVAYFLSGEAAAERTLASTSQLLDARTGTWAAGLASDQGIPLKLLPRIVEPASILGPLDERIAKEAGLREPPPVIAAASHDTACAVAAVPAIEATGWAYISSGTWSLVGVETPEPILRRDVIAHDFTNEAGVYGTTRFLRVVTGLWLVQECRRQWQREGTELGYERLADLAEAAPPAKAWLDLADPELGAPGDMPARIIEQCRASGQVPPKTRGEILRCALESLAREYLRAIRSAEELTGTKVERIHVVGGGSQNRLLDQLTADVLGVPVVAGPIEATAMGNVLLQAAACGDLGGLADIRRVVANSTKLETYRPRRR